MDRFDKYFIIYLFVFIKFIHSVDITDQQSLKAHEYYTTGIQLATTGENYQLALAYLRSACRLDNSSTLYWNDLGVTEMRTGKLQKSKMRFLKCLQIDPNYKVAQDNLNDLKAYMNISDYNIGIKSSYPQKHRRLKIPELTSKEFMNLDFNSYDILNKPFIIRNISQYLNWNLSHYTIPLLYQKYQTQRVDFYPQNMFDEKVHPFFTSFSNGIKQLLNYPTDIYETVDISNPGTYLQWNLNETIWNELLIKSNIQLPLIFDDKLWNKKCLSEDMIIDYQLKTHWKMLLIGSSRSGMFNHQDSLRTASYQIQIKGNKKWHLCSPLDSINLYRAGEVDMFRPDYERFPKLLNVTTCYQFIIKPNDFFYYPMDYWHQTLNLNTPTISLTGTLLTKHNYNQLIFELKQECNGRGSIFPKDPILCPKLIKCYRLWENMFQKLSEL